MDLAKKDTSRKEFGAKTKFASPIRNRTKEEDPSILPFVPPDTLSRMDVAGRNVPLDTLLNGIIGIDAKRIVRRERPTRRELVTRKDVSRDITRRLENVTRTLVLRDTFLKARRNVGDLAPNLTRRKDRNV
jgi:hypothetical protein